METITYLKKSSAMVWLWRSLLLVSLAAVLAAAPAAQASGSAVATITVYAPGAGTAVAVSVQRLDGSRWVTVDGSQAMLFAVTYRGVPFATWTVDPALYGQGPYRWIIYNQDGKTLWAASEPFYLPTRDGIELDETVTPGNAPYTAPVGLPPTNQQSNLTMPAPATLAPVMNATSTSGGTYCNTGDCGFAVISAYITGLPVTSWIAVEWLNPQGYWQPVPNWEGPPDLADPPTQRMYKAWTVLPSIYGHGLFRWAVYSGQNGGVLGVSPAFNLPSGDRQNNISYLSP